MPLCSTSARAAQEAAIQGGGFLICALLSLSEDRLDDRLLWALDILKFFVLLA